MAREIIRVFLIWAAMGFINQFLAYLGACPACSSFEKRILYGERIPFMIDAKRVDVVSFKEVCRGCAHYVFEIFEPRRVSVSDLRKERGIEEIAEEGSFGLHEVTRYYYHGVEVGSIVGERSFKRRFFRKGNKYL